MLLIALSESEKIIASAMFESIIKFMASRIAYDSAVKTEHISGSLQVSFMVFQITAAPTPA